jgi:hypothetical protein
VREKALGGLEGECPRVKKPVSRQRDSFSARVAGNPASAGFFYGKTWADFSLQRYFFQYLQKLH